MPLSCRTLCSASTEGSIALAPAKERLLKTAYGLFAHSWHILMKGSIVSAAEGDLKAAIRAKAMARTLIEQFR